jgi:uncharacterized coiled-coil protein SlyX
VNIYGVQVDSNIVALCQWVLALSAVLVTGWVAMVTVWAIAVQAGKWSERVDQEKRYIGNKVQADTALYERMRDLEYQKAKELQDLEIQEMKSKRTMVMEREKAQHSLITEELKGMADEQVSPVVPISSKR